MLTNHFIFRTKWLPKFSSKKVRNIRNIVIRGRSRESKICIHRSFYTTKLNNSVQPKISNFDEYSFNSLDVISFEAFEDVMSSLLPESTRSIVVGVSGGADSLLLSIFTSYYCNKYNIDLFCVTIDHMMREESSREAEIVHEWMESLNINHTIRQIQWDENSKINMNEARNMRYKLLREFLKEKNSNVLLTGHHLNDNIETFFIRISAGSGIDGLACIPSIRKVDNQFYLLRPFLKFTKDQIISTCIKYKQHWIEDRSNLNEDYQRIRVRNALQKLKNEYDVNEYDIYYLMDTFIQARKSFLNKSKDFLNNFSKINLDYGYIQLDYKEFQNLNIYDAQHVLSYAIHMISGKKMMKMSSILTAVKRIKDSKFKSFTLHHCWILLHENKSLILCLAPLPSNSRFQAIKYGESVEYRKTWKIHYYNKYNNHDNLIIRQINENDINILKKRYKEEYNNLKRSIPFQVFLSLPIITTEDGQFVEFLLSKEYISVSFCPHDIDESIYV